MYLYHFINKRVLYSIAFHKKCQDFILCALAVQTRHPFFRGEIRKIRQDMAGIPLVLVTTWYLLNVPERFFLWPYLSFDGRRIGRQMRTI